jgi:hypothetical protein
MIRARHHPVTPSRLSWVVMLFALPMLSATGCARYEYDIVEPAEFAGHVGTKTPATLTLDPVRYQAITQSDRLVLVMHNDSEEPLKLLGDDSFAVDAKGESHPLPTRTIAPRSATKLIFPPVRPSFRRSSSTSFGVGVGYSKGYGRRGYGRYGGFAGDPWYYDDYPRYYRLEDDGTVYWDWTGNGTAVRVRLVYQLGEKTFHHDFTFRRVKM